MSDAPHARICGEVNSKCATLRAASRLLPDLSARESGEMLVLMVEEALRLAKSLEEYRQYAVRHSSGGHRAGATTAAATRR